MTGDEKNEQSKYDNLFYPASFSEIHLSYHSAFFILHSCFKFETFEQPKASGLSEGLRMDRLLSPVLLSINHLSKVTLRVLDG